MRERCDSSDTEISFATILTLLTGTMRRRQPRCAMHKLCSLLDRLQDPNTKAQEDVRKERVGKVRNGTRYVGRVHN